jgi:hypothetical protein
MKIIGNWKKVSRKKEIVNYHLLYELQTVLFLRLLEADF